MDFYTNLKDICKIQNTTISNVLECCNFSKSKGTQWKNGSLPNSDAIIKLANYLSVSTDYLLTGKEPSISTEYEGLISSYKELSNDNKRLIIKFMEDMVNVQTSTKE